MPTNTRKDLHKGGAIKKETEPVANNNMTTQGNDKLTKLNVTEMKGGIQAAIITLRKRCSVTLVGRSQLTNQPFETSVTVEMEVHEYCQAHFILPQ